jgi:hypothetical protein
MPSVDRKLFEFDPTDVRRRCGDTWEIAEEFVKNILTNPPWANSNAKLLVNGRRLFLAVESAYQDIARYKNYHQIDPWNEKLDCVKRSAYMTKWIVKIKPIILIGNDGDEVPIEDDSSDTLELVNELFALYLFEQYLSFEISRDVALSIDKAWELAYDLLFRNISVDGWIAIFQLFKDVCESDAVSSVNFLEIL